METSTSLGIFEEFGFVESFETGDYEMLLRILDEFRISKHLTDPYYAFILTSDPLERVKMMVYKTPAGVPAHSLIVLKVDGEVVGESLYEGEIKTPHDIYNKYDLNHTEGLDAFNDIEIVRKMLIAVTEEYLERLRTFEF